MKRDWLRQASHTTIAAMAMLAFTAGSGFSQTDTVADSIFNNGNIVTVDGDFSTAEAFAVKDGKFLAVGTMEEIEQYAGPSTEIVDLGGHTVIPGLSDNHVHNVGGGPGIDLSKARSIAELLEAVAEAARDADPDTVLVGNSDWHEAQLQEQRKPTAAELESAAPGIPIVLRRGGHSYFLNESAFAHYNITSETPVPLGGLIARDEEGNLTGEVTNLARSLVPLPAEEPVDPLEGLLAEQAVMNSHGLVNVRIPGTSVAHYQQLQELAEAGSSTVRFSVLFRQTAETSEAPISPESLSDAGIEPLDGDEWVKVWGIKISVDGGFEGGRMTVPYASAPSAERDYRGLQRVPQDAYTAAIKAWNQAGWRVATHAVGDAAMDQVLEAYQAAHEDQSIADKGWAVEHAFITRADQYPLMRDLGLRLSVQNHLYLAAPTLRELWGAERAANVTPVRTYLDEGFEVSGGTDAAVIPINPFWVLYHFISRDTMSAGVFGEEQGVSREEALQMLTINYAVLTDETDIKGSIEPGKFADFVVLSDDYMTIPVSEIEDLFALATYVDGKEVYRHEDASF